MNLKEGSRAIFESQRNQDYFIKEFLRELQYHHLYSERNMRSQDILEVVRFEARTNEVKLGFKFDHIAFAVYELNFQRKLRLPREVRDLIAS